MSPRNPSAGKSYSFLLNLFGIDDRSSISFFALPSSLRWVDYLLLAAYYLLFFILFGILFQRRQKVEEEGRTTSSIAGISFGLMLGFYAITSYSREFENMAVSPQLTACIHLYSVLGSLFIILLCLGVLEYDRLSRDLSITEQLLLHEKKQYEMSRKNVETINQRCHDLKHRLDTMEGRINEKKLIDIAVRRELGSVRIEFGNYFSGSSAVPENGSATSKADVNRHGYGLKSMRYVIEQYGGTMSSRVEGDIFILSFELPLRGEFAGATA